jgi:hypothetical protein
MVTTKGCGKSCPANGHLLCELHDPNDADSHMVAWPKNWVVANRPSPPPLAFHWNGNKPDIYRAWEPLGANSWIWNTYKLPVHIMPQAGQAMPGAFTCGRRSPANPNLICDGHDGNSHIQKRPGGQPIPSNVSAIPEAQFFWVDDIPAKWYSWALVSGISWSWVGRDAVPLRPPEHTLVIVPTVFQCVEEDDLLDATPSELRRVQLELGPGGELVQRSDTRFERK